VGHGSAAAADYLDAGLWGDQRGHPTIAKPTIRPYCPTSRLEIESAIPPKWPPHRAE
jgi:hypothetical protein